MLRPSPPGLIYAGERDGQGEWAKPAVELLLKIKGQIARSGTGVLDIRQGRRRKRYRELTAEGLRKGPQAAKEDGGLRGKVAQAKAVDLLLRLRDKEGEALRFMAQADAKFDNNQAERDLRMNKVRQKVFCGLSPKAAGSLVQSFEDAGILKEFTGQARNRVFVFEEYLDLFK